MRKVILTLALLAIAASPALGESVNRDGPFQAPPPYNKMPDILGRGPSLVAVVNEATFTDLGPMYGGFLDAAGYPHDIIYDPLGAWPAMGGYDVCLVTFAENWWGYMWLVPQDEDVLAAYMDAGGQVILIGQDYLYFRGGSTGFPRDYLGVCGHVDDLLWDDTSLMTWYGTTGSPLEGITDAFLAGDCYTATDNYFFTDQVDPCTQGLLIWETELFPVPTEGGSVYGHGIFSCVDFGCGQEGAAAIREIMTYFGGVSAADDNTWGSIKGLYR